MRLVLSLLIVSGACESILGAAMANFFRENGSDRSLSSSPTTENENRRRRHQRPRLWLGRGGSLQSSSRSSSSSGSSSSQSPPAQSSAASAASSTNPFRRKPQPDTSSGDSRMPSLFPAEESVFDRYAACLAATEGLRRIRDRDLAEEVNLRGFGAASTSSSGGGSLYDAERQINLNYVQNSERVLRALGMSVNQFNELGKQVTQDEKLREKVMEQAYLYRMAATIHMDRMPLLEDAQSRAALLKAYQRDKVDLFCESMTEIEQLRGNQIERLKRSLRVEQFPENLPLSDPVLLPFLSPKVRAVIEAFPYQAEEIIKRHGLQSDEFNKMLEETRSNPLFRWKVQKHLRKDGAAPHEAGAVAGAVAGNDPLAEGPGKAFRANR